MIGNTSILIFTIVIISFNVYIFKFHKNANRLVKRLSVFLLVMCFLSILLPSLPNLLFPLTKSPVVRVVDSVANKPIPGLNVKVAWMVESGTAGGGSPQPYKELTLKTNEQGEFKIPATIKPMSICIFPIYTRWYGRISVVAYGIDYQYIKYEIGPKDRDKYLELKISKVRDDESYLKNTSDLPLALHFMHANYKKESLSEDELEFILKAHQAFNIKFPTSKLNDQNCAQIRQLITWILNYSLKNKDGKVEISLLKDIFKSHMTGNNLICAYSALDNANEEQKKSRQQRGEF